MKILKYIIILFLCLAFISFNKTESNNSNFLFQKWVYEKYDNDNLIYQSKRKFKKDKPGIEFKENGTINRKQNSSWCGTEIEYETVSGTWKNISDSLFVIEYKNWNGRNIDTLQIVELTKTKLAVKPIYTVKKE